MKGEKMNKVMIIGKLGKDAECKYTPDGTMITSFSVATSEKYKDKHGEKVEKTEWHNITAFRKLAEICAEYLKKGSQVYCEGKLQTDKWEKDGKKYSSTKIILEKMEMLGSKKTDNTGQQQSESVPF
jgi:single-strand DNA-binding protein